MALSGLQVHKTSQALVVGAYDEHMCSPTPPPSSRAFRPEPSRRDCARQLQVPHRRRTGRWRCRSAHANAIAVGKVADYLREQGY